jgi:hypothetical protein
MRSSAVSSSRQFAEKVGGPASKGVDIETDEMVFRR